MLFQRHYIQMNVQINWYEEGDSVLVIIINESDGQEG